MMKLEKQPEHHVRQYITGSKWAMVITIICYMAIVCVSYALPSDRLDTIPTQLFFLVGGLNLLILLPLAHQFLTNVLKTMNGIDEDSSLVYQLKKEIECLRSCLWVLASVALVAYWITAATIFVSHARSLYACYCWRVMY